MREIKFVPYTVGAWLRDWFARIGEAPACGWLSYRKAVLVIQELADLQMEATKQFDEEAQT